MTEWTDPMTADGQEMGTTEVDADAGGAGLGTPSGGEAAAPEFDPDAGGPSLGDAGVAGDEAGSTAFGEEEMGGPGASDEA